jgi:hypothetical protein
MYYKSQTHSIGDVANKQAYALEHGACEVCGKRLGLEIHHRIKQHKRYMNERYTIELPLNYAVLCRHDHERVHNGKGEAKYSELVGTTFEEFMSNYLAKGDKNDN